MKGCVLVGLLVLVALPTQAVTHYGDFGSWSAATGAVLTEDFESYPELRLPVDGGFTELDHFSIYNDDQGANDWTGLSGIYQGSNWYAWPEIPDTKSLIISTEGSGDYPGDGPLVIDAVFPEPILAIALEYSWCEDDPTCAFDGFVFDTPVTQFSLWEPGYFNHSWGAIEAIYWTPVPEPATGLLVLSGLIALHARASGRARRRTT